MISMEFNEMKKIWDTQNNEAFYGINEKALHKLIISKQKKGYHITNTSELLMIFVNTITGCTVLAVNLNKPEGNIFLYGLAAWMLVTASYFLRSRIHRMKHNHQFDRSMRGDLEHAISVATYQVRLSLL